MTMLVTILLSLLMMAGLFLMLWSGVGFIQDKRFFSSAPQAVQAAVLPKPERFRGAHALGWVMAVFALVLMGGALVLGAWDGIRHGFGFWQFFVRFLVMLWGLEAYDVLFFDFYLLCRSGFFPRYYPEVEKLLGPHLFGYNRRSHLIAALVIPAACLAVAWICTHI